MKLMAWGQRSWKSSSRMSRFNFPMKFCNSLFRYYLAVAFVLLLSTLPARSESAPPAASGVLNELPLAPAAPPITEAAGEVAISSPVPYYVDRGVTMVPIRPLCEFLGVRITMLDRVLTLAKQSEGDPAKLRLITLRVNGSRAQITDGVTTRQAALARPAEMRLGNTFVQLRFVAESFGATLSFRARDKALVIAFEGRIGVLTPPAINQYNGSDVSTLTITNRVGRALSLRLGGPQSVVLELANGQSVTRRLRPGVYYYQAGSAGMKPRSGARRLLAGRRSTWSWGTR